MLRGRSKIQQQSMAWARLFNFRLQSSQVPPRPWQATSQSWQHHEPHTSSRVNSSCVEALFFDDRGRKETLRTAIETAQRADTIIYSILFKDDEDRSFGGGFGGIGMGGHHGGPGDGRSRYPQEPRVDGKKILEQMSRETGGRLFEVSGKQTVEKIYAEIEEDLRNQYSLGYTPDRTNPSEGFHKISVKTKQKDLVVHAREEYYWGQ